MIEDLFNQRIELNSFHKRIKTKTKPLEEKLAAKKMSRADIKDAQETAISPKAYLENKLAWAESENKAREDDLDSL